MGVNSFYAIGVVIAEADQPQPQGFGMAPLLIIGALLIGFMMWSNRRRQKQAAQFRSNLRPGQRVQLYAGLKGTLVTVGEREVFIELAPGVVVTAVPQAVQGIVDEPSDDADDAEPTQIDSSEDDDSSDRDN